MNVRENLKQAASSALRGLWLLLSCFFIHRICSYPYLNTENPQTFSRILDVLFVGVLSDLWVASVASGAIFLLSLTLMKFMLFKRFLFITIFLCVALSLCLHQGYVEFFRIQMLLFHLKYLFDAKFVSANGFAVPTVLVLFQMLVYPALGILFLRGRIFKKYVRRPMLVWCVTLGIALCAHMLNIHWRVQHFIPEYLQCNVFEKLYRQSVRSVKVPDLEESTLAKLYKSVKGEDWLGSPEQLLESVVTWNIHEEKMQDFAVALKTRFRTSIVEGAKPLVLIVLLESARPTDFSLYAQAAGLTIDDALTPRFDELAAKGVWFTNAYSTGTVTRAGQEAVWCGTLSSMYSALMRERTDLNWPCLPQRLAERVDAFWYHGGDPEFDSQKGFWTKQQVSHLWAREHFPEDTGKGWGVGDKRLFDAAAKGILQLHRDTNKAALIGQILTLTNHIPWGLPDDFSNQALRRSLRNHHPSALTTAYVDEAIGQFVDDMKKNDLWDRSIIFFVSDHGAKVPSFYPIYKDDAFINARLMSHVVLLLSGGLTEKTLQEGNYQYRNAEMVSQAGVAAFLGWLLDDPDGKYAAEPLLVKKRRAPVFAQLETSYFFPEHPSELQRSNLHLNSTSNLESVANKDYAYLNAFLNFLEKPRTVSNKN